jgi:hypothetical protein
MCSTVDFQLHSKYHSRSTQRMDKMWYAFSNSFFFSFQYNRELSTTDFSIRGVYRRIWSYKYHIPWQSEQTTIYTFHTFLEKNVIKGLVCGAVVMSWKHSITRCYFIQSEIYQDAVLHAELNVWKFKSSSTKSSFLTTTRSVTNALYHLVPLVTQFTTSTQVKIRNVNQEP